MIIATIVVIGGECSGPGCVVVHLRLYCRFRGALRVGTLFDLSAPASLVPRPQFLGDQLFVE